MQCYRIEYLANGHWTPGNLVQMDPKHLRAYLEFLAGDRPLITYLKVNGHPSFKKVVERKKEKCLPTRVRTIEPTWCDEDGYYLFDGETIEFIDLSELDGWRVPKNA